MLGWQHSDTKYTRWHNDAKEIQGWHLWNESVAKSDANVMIGWHLCEDSDTKYANVIQCNPNKMLVWHLCNAPVTQSEANDVMLGWQLSDTKYTSWHDDANRYKVDTFVMNLWQKVMLMWCKVDTHVNSLTQSMLMWYHAIIMSCEFDTRARHLWHKVVIQTN